MNIVVAPLFLPREDSSFNSGKNNGVVPRTLAATANDPWCNILLTLGGAISRVREA
jgi:hypothetical protein